MFPLAGSEFPTAANDLASAIEEALGEVFKLKKGTGAAVEGGEKFPHVKHVRIDLDGARVDASEPPPKPIGVGKRKRGITVDRLEISGHPIHYEKAKLDLELDAKGLSFDFDRDKAGRPLLVLTDADEGTVEAKISKKDIDALLLAAVTLGAKQQGVAIQEFEVALTSNGPRSVAAEVRIKAKKMMMSGVIRVTGAVDVDDELNAAISGLRCTGEGIVGTTAAAFLQKHLAEYDGQEFPLMAFSLGDLALRDLEIELNGTLQVSAAFGKSKGKTPRKGKTKHA
jgi:hypothetical protein